MRVSKNGEKANTKEARHQRSERLFHVGDMYLMNGIRLHRRGNGRFKNTLKGECVWDLSSNPKTSKGGS